MTSSRKTPAWLLRPLLAAAGLTLVGISGWYGPIVTASIWRLFHPLGRVHYRGLTVRVPWPWVADTEAIKEDAAIVPQGLSLRKMPPTSIHRQAAETIFITVISPDPGITTEQQTDLWLAAFRGAHPGASFATATSTGLPAGASCAKALYPAKADDLVWTCISMSGGWVANLEGHPSAEPVYFGILGGLKN